MPFLNPQYSHVQCGIPDFNGEMPASDWSGTGWPFVTVLAGESLYVRPHYPSGAEGVNAVDEETAITLKRSLVETCARLRGPYFMREITTDILFRGSIFGLVCFDPVDSDFFSSRIPTQVTQVLRWKAHFDNYARNANVLIHNARSSFRYRDSRLNALSEKIKSEKITTAEGVYAAMDELWPVPDRNNSQPHFAKAITPERT